MADERIPIPCVIVFKAAKDKSTQKTLLYQVAQVTTKCVDKNLKIVDGIVTHGGLKDVKRELTAIIDRKLVCFLFFYSPKNIARTSEEFYDYVDDMKKEHNISVFWLRA